MVDFILGFHCHQPVGNFEYIFEKVHRESYGPLVRTLTKHKVRFSFHSSGILLEWWEKNDPDFIKIIADGVSAGLIELMGGGYYEPVLASIPGRDRTRQLEMQNSACERLFGRTPEGAWITERIWQPDIIACLKDAGIKYAFLDDYQFFQAGVSPENIDNIFRTEYGGDYIDLFPIHERLRYHIPFANPDESLRSVLYMENRTSRLSVMFDDGEKMGAWPDTYEWVYGKDGKEGWLDGFIRLARESLNFELPGEVLKRVKTRLPAYLPISSYREMGEWTLSPEKRIFYEAARVKKEPAGLAGGIWHNFFPRYPESNLFHKRMLVLSEKIDKAAEIYPGVKGRALDELLKSQANDAYWHGIFGGIYIPHLRKAIRNALIMACVKYKQFAGCGIEIQRADLDMDGEDEIQVSNNDWLVVYKPSNGTVIALDCLKEGIINPLGDVFCLHKEYDVIKILDESGISGCEPGKKQDNDKNKEDSGENNPPLTIHSQVKYPEGLCLNDLSYRTGLMPAFEMKLNGENLVFKEPCIKKDEEGGWIEILSRGFRPDGHGTEALDMIIKISQKIDIKLDLKPFNEENTVFEAVFRLAFPGGNGPAVSISMDDFISGLNREFEGEINTPSSNEIRVKDAFWGAAATVKCEAASGGKFHVRPVRTISLSENGFERIFQGIEIFFNPVIIKGRTSLTEFSVWVEKI